MAAFGTYGTYYNKPDQLITILLKLMLINFIKMFRVLRYAFRNNILYRVFLSVGL